MLRRRTRDGDPESGGDAERFRQWLESLDPRWQAPVRSALESRDQYAGIVARTPTGPTRERLEGIADTIDTAVARVTDAAWRAANASVVASGLDVAGATEELKEARRRLDTAQRSGRDVGALEARVDALAERHRAMHDALNLAEDAEAGLQDANVRLETIVARAATVAMRSGGGDPLDQLETDLREVVDGLGALDDALADFA